MINQGYTIEETTRGFLTRVFGWMGIGLAITAFVSYFTAHSPVLLKAIFEKGLFWVLIIAQLACVLLLQLAIERMNALTASIMFLAYSALTGVTLSSIFLVYELGSIALVFLTTSVTFTIMALYAYFTRSDLSSLGNFLFMGLIGLIISTGINMFFRSPQATFLISAFGVILFTLLTAYDVQRLKVLSRNLAVSQEDAFKISIIGALQLYLDFINLFLYLLQFMGRRRN